MPGLVSLFVRVPHLVCLTDMREARRQKNFLYRNTAKEICTAHFQIRGESDR